MTENVAAESRLLTMEEVRERLGISRTKLWELRTGNSRHPSAEPVSNMVRFPPPAKFGNRTLRWREADIDAYIEASQAS